MNKSLRIVLITGGVLLGALAFLWTGLYLGRNTHMMSNTYGGYMIGSGMMSSSTMMGNFYGRDNVDPLSSDEARESVESYLSDLGNDDLQIEEIMIFDNNAYAIIVEESTGVGAFELLVDPITKSVFPEYGPNMMWNLKYGMHTMGDVAMMSDSGGYDMMGPGMMSGGFGASGMMSGHGFGSSEAIQEISADMPVSVEDAELVAQTYLDRVYPGVEISDEVTAFYGYYTIDLERDGSIVGMLSVNGYTSQVFPHTWHGEFVEMTTQ